LGSPESAFEYRLPLAELLERNQWHSAALFHFSMNLLAYEFIELRRRHLDEYSPVSLPKPSNFS
jgi:thiosulfate reductase cytochrome b subunit